MPQSTAFTAFSQSAGLVQTTLEQCAEKIKGFWEYTAGVMAGLALFVFTARFAAATLPAFLVALATAVATAAGAIYHKYSSCRDEINELSVQLVKDATDNSPYGDGWPRAGRSLLTGSPRRK